MLSRRQALRGMLDGIAVTVGMPFLDCFLDDNGAAIAATGQPLPVRFGTWFWGHGVNPPRWFPNKTGADYDLKTELEPVRQHREKVNVFSNFTVPLDSRPNIPHVTGGVAIRSGVTPPPGGRTPGASFDVLISDVIGKRSRFPSLEMSATGDSRNSFSTRGNGNLNPAEGTAAGLYARIFGAGFQNPKGMAFRPDPAVMARRSVLSGVEEQRKALEQNVGARDRQRLDQYFTSLRQLERRLDFELSKAEPLQSCVLPGRPDATLPLSADIDKVIANHELMVDLLVMALACDNTRVFNMSFNQKISGLTRQGSTITHHQLTHEELVESHIGHQPKVAFFINKIMAGWAYLVKALDSVVEGDRTLLDSMIVFAHSETEFAKFHTIDNIPMMTAGSGGRRIRTGIHIDGGASPVSRLGLTLQQVMGVATGVWGTESLETRNPVAELLV